jgi:hypothetical protein
MHTGTQRGTGTSEGSTTHWTGNNSGSNSGLPQEAEGESDHLPMRQPSNCIFGGEIMSLRFRERGESTVLYKSV